MARGVYEIHGRIEVKPARPEGRGLSGDFCLAPLLSGEYILDMQRAVYHTHPHLLSYQRQDSYQTLAEGLEEYYAANADKVIRPRDLPPESVELFLSHDMCHVIFGLNTSLDDEALADMRTLFSCDVGVRHYYAYLSQDKQAKALFKELGYFKSALVTTLAIPRICRAAAEAWRMKKRWPWRPPKSFLNRSLADLRREFGIRVI
jgi:hypothetical protein